MDRLDFENSFAGRHGLSVPDQYDAFEKVLSAIREAELEVIRISFVDQHGILRGKTLVTEGIGSILAKGINITSTLLLKDTSHRTVFPVWDEDASVGSGSMVGASDVVMIPDFSTFRVLPWAHRTGWVMADLHYPGGQPVEFSTRGILKSAQKKLNDCGLEFIAGLEVELHVFTTRESTVSYADAGQPGTPPKTDLLSQGYQYLTEERYDDLESTFELIRRNAQALGLPVRSLEVEFGPSQIEVTFDPGPALQQADNMVLFRSMVKQVCRRNGLHATFMCRPRFDDSMASGWHLHQSILDIETGINQFIPEPGQPISDFGRNWIAGILKHAEESCILSTPTINGYKRYRAGSLAPDRIQWGRDNRGAMIRCLAAPGDKASRIENRVGEPAANPYLYLASQILSGLEGVEKKLEAPEPVANPYDSTAVRLPKSLADALLSFKSSEFYKAELGVAFVDYYSRIKSSEWDRYLTTVSEWEEREYFNLF